jgi:serine/threonine-protein kinase
VILRCIEKDPDKRPSSALQVAAALPGGDPLAAALAAGETPSPEMVAAATHEGALSPLLAAAMFAGVIAGLLAVVFLSGKVMLHRRVPLDKSAEALTERAADVVRKLGYTDAPVDRERGFDLNQDYLQHILLTDHSRTRWQRLSNGRPAAITFNYNQGPRYFETYIGSIAADSPSVPSGTTRVVLDTQGQLRKFVAVPPQQDLSTTTQPEESILVHRRLLYE